jgi:hypothetical protein
MQLNQWGPINVSYELNAVAFKIPISEINLLVKNVSRIRKKTFYLQFFMGTPDMATNLQAESKILKKILEHQIYQSKQKISKKTVFRTLKVERGQIYARVEFAGPTQNPKKNIRTSNQPIKTKIFPKKVCLVP